MVKSIVLECNEFQANLEKYVLSFEFDVSAISRDDFTEINKWLGTVIEPFRYVRMKSKPWIICT